MLIGGCGVAVAAKNGKPFEHIALDADGKYFSSGPYITTRLLSMVIETSCILSSMSQSLKALQNSSSS